MRTTAYASGVVLVFALAACGGASPVGRWAEGTGPDACSPREAIEFAGDGQVREGTRGSGTWRQDGNRVIVTDRGREFPLTLDGDTLTMQEGSRQETLRRCPD